MYPSIDTRHPSEVEIEVHRLCRTMFPEADPYLVTRAFDWAKESFAGHYSGYQPIDALYHDLEHTLQGTLCLVRLMQGRQLAQADPPLTLRMFELGLLAILMHDTGYLKTADDTEGTGAKYTLIHVDRSADFAAALLGEKGYAKADIAAIRNMIHCTGVNVNLEAISFADELERTIGYALGSADLLGQMAADDYIDKLPILYLEFEETAVYNEGRMTRVGTFISAEDLMRKTPLFWSKYVQPKLNKDFRGVYRYLNQPYPDGPNFYVQRIEANLERLSKRLAAMGAQ
jgi:hypothetical protein